MILKLLLVVLGGLGLFISVYINQTKRRGEKLVCPVGASCGPVIQSKYSRFFGIPVELIGALYYGSVVLYYGGSFLLSYSIPLIVTSVVFFATLGAFLFSIYLTFIQAFVLDSWCSWCLCSAGLCTLIFLSAVLALPNGLVAFLQNTYLLVWNIHLLAAVLGVGGVTAYVILFIKFLGDLRISEREASILKVLFDVEWLAVLVFAITALGIYMPDLMENVISVDLFTKFVVSSFIIANAAMLHFFVEPRLQRISYGEEHRHEEGELRKIHKATFGLGAVALSSWYFMFFISLLEPIGLNVLVSVGTYLGVVSVAVILSQFVEVYFSSLKEK